MTTSTYFDVTRVQRRTTQHQRLAMAIALVGLVAMSVTTLVHVGPINGQTSAIVSELTGTHELAPEFAQRPGLPY
jgi:hypothetical protein